MPLASPEEDIPPLAGDPGSPGWDTGSSQQGIAFRSGPLNEDVVTRARGSHR